MADSQHPDPFRSAVSPAWQRAFKQVSGLCALSALGCALSACAPDLNWREVQVDEADGLSALFPCKPDRIERKIAWQDVPGGVTMRMLSCDTDGRNWSLSYVTLPEVNLVQPALRQWPGMVRANLERAAAASGGAVRAQDMGPVNVARMTPSEHARAWYFEGPGTGRKSPPRDQHDMSALHTWHFVHGMTVFQASVSGAAEPVNQQSSEDVTQAFFEGFHFPG
jgi:hypothetical protein